MKRQPTLRERCIYNLSLKNRWYQYEREKKHLNPQNREVEARLLAEHLRV